MNFKDFLKLNENAPLGNIQSFNDGSIGVHNDGPGGGFSLKQIGGGYLDSQWTGTEADPTQALSGHPLHLGSLDLQIPDEVEEKIQGTVAGFTNEAYKSSRIPIQIESGEGNRKHYSFTPEEYQRIMKTGCHPQIMDGDTLVIVQEKIRNDLEIKGKKPSPKIKRCKCYPTSRLRKAR
jgi:hypothetical protein